MLTAEVTRWGLPPKPDETQPLPPLPEPDSGHVQVKLLATAVHTLVRLRASGKHYSASTLPHRPGTDGVGIVVSKIPQQERISADYDAFTKCTEHDGGVIDSGQLVYFNALHAGGSFAERINVPQKDVIPLPAGTDPVQAAALMNPALSSWMALRTRCFSSSQSKNTQTRDLKVLVLGATTLSGRVAVPLLRRLGVRTIVGCARHRESIEGLGFDECIGFAEGGDNGAFQFGRLETIDIVLDYLCGAPALQLLQALPKSHKTTFVMIGNIAGRELTLPASLLRSKNVTLLGSGIGSFSIDEMQRELPDLVQYLSNIPRQKVRTRHLKEIEAAWVEPGERLVVVP